MSRTYIKPKSKLWLKKVITAWEEQERPDAPHAGTAWPKQIEKRHRKRTLRADKKGNPFRIWWSDDPPQKPVAHKWERRVRKQQVLREELNDEDNSWPVD